MLKISKIAVPGVAEPYDIGTLSIPFGQVDSTSTDTAYTAQIEGITSLYDGVCVYLKNGVITSNKNGFTLNINGLGAKPVYDTLAAATRSGTVFNVDYTMLFVYNSSRVSGGCWDIFYGYNSDTTDLEEALTPLTGTTETLTPTQVYDAIKSGKSVVLQHTNSEFGLFTFASFNIFEGEKAVVSTSIAKYRGVVYLVGSLAGFAEADGKWVFNITKMAEADDIPVAVNEALAQAKANGDFDGADGLTPTIGDNGNWYLGNTDTGKPSRGDKGEKGDKGDKGDTGETGATGATGAAGAAGKSAYAYAQDGGYTGTEAEFAAKLAEEMPTALPNPNALTFTGAVEGSYDGSAPVSVEIPGGGAAVETWNLLINAEIAEDCTEVIFNSGDSGETLSDYKELLLLIDLFGNTGGFTSVLKIGFLNAVIVWHSPYFLNMTGYSAETVKYYINMFRFKKTEYGILPVNRYTQYNSGSVSNGLRHANGDGDPIGYTDFTLPISANQHVTTDMTDFTSQKEFERLVIGGYQAIIGAGTIIKVWGMK